MTIGIWGDSITFGSCDSEALGWVGRLRKSLVSDDIDVYNLGVCSETSADVLKRFVIEAEAVEPTSIVFAIGINDSKYPAEVDTSKVSLEEYRLNLEKLIVQARGFASSIFIIGATRVDDGWKVKHGSRFVNEQIQNYNEVMKDVAARNKLTFIDVFDVLNPETDLADGLHPNADGYRKLFEVIKSALV